jgi:hypothetical protein
VTAYTGDWGSTTLLESLESTAYMTIDRSVVKMAVRNTYDAPFFGLLTTLESDQRTTSIHARAEAKLKPATTELRAWVSNCAPIFLVVETKESIYYVAIFFYSMSSSSSRINLYVLLIWTSL